ncbi:MAG: SufD family Fe-S cluster assembly protein [Lentilactobacillus diolivorans]
MASATSLSEERIARLPKYAGVKVATSLFDWHQLGETSWNWNVNPAAMQELASVGGRIQSFSGHLSDKTILKLLASQMEQNNWRSALLAHYQQAINCIAVLVPDNVRLHHKLNLTIDADSSHLEALTVVTVMGSNSRLSLNQDIEVSGMANCVSVIVDGTVGTSSQLNATTIVRSRRQVDMTIVANQELSAKASNNWSVMAATKGALLGDVKVNLNQAGSRAELSTLGISEDQEVGLPTKVNHLAPHTVSKVNV